MLKMRLKLHYPFAARAPPQTPLGSSKHCPTLLANVWSSSPNPSGVVYGGPKTPLPIIVGSV